MVPRLICLRRNAEYTQVLYVQDEHAEYGYHEVYAL